MGELSVFIAVSKPPRDLGTTIPTARETGWQAGVLRWPRQRASRREAGVFAPGVACQSAGRPGFLPRDPHIGQESPSRPAWHRGLNRVTPSPSGLELGPATSHPRRSVRWSMQVTRPGGSHEARDSATLQTHCKGPWAQGESHQSGDFKQSTVRAFSPLIYHEETEASI